uniref:Uncharacterized protein n=1 Tax=Moniliophthora roreri TaxID=221103 RepID=A0A0W0FY00_MONRR
MIAIPNMDAYFLSFLLNDLHGCSTKSHQDTITTLAQSLKTSSSTTDAHTDFDPPHPAQILFLVPISRL